MTQKPARTSLRKRLGIGVLLAAVVILAAYLILTSPPVVRVIVLGWLEQATGGRFIAESAHLRGSSLTIVSPRLSVPGLPGPASEVFTADRIEALLDLSALWRGRIEVREVRLDRPSIRISQSVGDGTMNVESLTNFRNRGSGSSSPLRPPNLVVHGGTIEIGEHRADPDGHVTFTVLERLTVEGEVVESPTESGVSVFTFAKESAPGASGVAAAQGRISSEGVSLRLPDVRLEDLTPEALPTRLRERFKALQLSGGIDGAVFRYRFDGAVEARVGLADVAITLPIAPEPHYNDQDELVPLPEGQEAHRPRMERVRGQVVLTDSGIVGELTGIIEALPYDVTFDVRGGDADAPFTARLVCREFELTRHPNIALFVPGIVRNRLAQFSHPTGMVNADVTVRREVAGGPVEVRGVLDLTGGSAAFERFPYRFTNMTARAEFDQDGLRLTNITGEAAGGVRLTASADISPLTDDAGVDIKVKVTGLPVDLVLHTAMRSRGKLIDELFDLNAYARLLEQGLVLSPARERELRARAEVLRASSDPTLQAELETVLALLDRPVFQPGGAATVTVGVQRRIGPESIWFDQVHVHFEHVDLLPRAFPYPLRGRDVSLAKIDYEASVSGGEYRGLTGASARIGAKLDLEKFDAPGVPFVPDVEIVATGVPADELLYFAIPDAEGLSPDGRPLRDVIRRLGLDGKGDADARVFQLESGEPGYSIRVNTAGMTVTPDNRREPGHLILSELRGGLDIRHDGLDFDLRGRCGAIGAADSPLTMRAQLAWRSEPATGSSSLLFMADATDLDAATPVGELVALFSPDAADALTGLRRDHQPTGRADVVCEVKRTGGTTPDVRIIVSNIENAEIDLRGARVAIADCRGRVEYTRLDGRGAVRFHDFDAVVSGNGGEAGRLSLDGMAQPPEGSPVGLLLGLTGARWEHPLVREAFRSFAPSGIVDVLESTDSAGDFSLNLRMSPGAPDGPNRVIGTLAPRRWTGMVHGVPLALEFEAGSSVEFTQDGGTLKNVRLSAPLWHGSLDGGWVRSVDGSIATHAALSIEAQRLSPDLVATLPGGVRELLVDLRLDAAGPLQAQGVTLSLSFDPAGSLAAYRTSGRIIGSEVSLDAGVSLTRCELTTDFEAWRSGPGVGAEFKLFALAPSLTAAGVRMTDARVRVEGDAESVIVVQHFSADAHGGRISGTAMIDPPTPGGSREYTMNVQGAGLRLAPVLADFRGESGAGDVAPDPSRGLMDFGVSMAGRLNAPGTRRGRGTVLVGSGRVLEMPLVVSLIRLSNLQLPTDENLDYGQADFFISGERIELERAWLSSPSVELYGFGTIGWPGLEADLVVRTRARGGLPLVRGVMERIRDELATASVTGTLSKPEVGVRSFGGATRLVKGMFGDTPSAEERRLDQIMALARRDPRRSREAEPGVVPSSPP